ncbi:potassium channel family protein [Candidatus Saccharibacteria bacterium]|nr:potassium channel family protein [Candidatus Saccharibacteria bacterium]
MKPSVNKYLYRYLSLAALSMIILGTVFYHLQEHLSWLNAYYFSVISLTTVGYGDITPHTPLGKIFTTFYVLIGIGIITTFVSLRMQRRAEHISNRRSKKD